jgi:hypothetical protein
MKGVAADVAAELFGSQHWQTCVLVEVTPAMQPALVASQVHRSPLVTHGILSAMPAAQIGGGVAGGRFEPGGNVNAQLLQT